MTCIGSHIPDPVSAEVLSFLPESDVIQFAMISPKSYHMVSKYKVVQKDYATVGFDLTENFISFYYLTEDDAAVADRDKLMDVKEVTRKQVLSFLSSCRSIESLYWNMAVDNDIIKLLEKIEIKNLYYAPCKTNATNQIQKQITQQFGNRLIFPVTDNDEGDRFNVGAGHFGILHPIVQPVQLVYKEATVRKMFDATRTSAMNLTLKGLQVLQTVFSPVLVLRDIPHSFRRSFKETLKIEDKQCALKTNLIVPKDAIPFKGTVYSKSIEIQKESKIPFASQIQQIRKLFLKKNIDFSKTENVGSGNYSHVVTAMNTSTDTKIAVKFINIRQLSDAYKTKYLPSEIECWKRLKHHNLIELLGHFEAFDYVLLTMEYGSGGDLLEYVQANGAVPEEKARKWSRQIISAVDYMHSKKIFHRDLKLENIVVFSESCIKVCDFGYAREMSTDLSSTYCGSKSYTAPEVLMGEPHSPFKADVWSTGVVIFIMVTDSMPFKGDQANEKIVECQRGRTYRNSCWNPLSDKCKHMISSMMNFDWKKRPTIIQCLSHEWLEAS